MAVKWLGFDIQLTIQDPFLGSGWSFYLRSVFTAPILIVELWNVLVNGCQFLKVLVTTMLSSKNASSLLFLCLCIWLYILRWVESGLSGIFHVHLQPNRQIWLSMLWESQNMISHSHWTHVAAVIIVLNFISYPTYTNLTLVVTVEGSVFWTKAVSCIFLVVTIEGIFVNVFLT